MAKAVYLISEAAKEVCVENHVLRYWEEELSLPVKRNSQGHRYYTAEDVKTFKKIKHLKEQGLQLKAIKLFLSRDGKLISCQSAPDKPEEKKSNSISSVLHEGDKVTSFCREIPQQERSDEEERKQTMTDQSTEKQPAPGQLIGMTKTPQSMEDPADKAQKLQMVLKIMIEEVLKEYDSGLKDSLGEEVCERLCTDVKDAVIKEMDYQFRMQEERKEQYEQERSEKEEKLIQRIEELIKLKKEEKRKPLFWRKEKSLN